MTKRMDIGVWLSGGLLAFLLLGSAIRATAFSEPFYGRTFAQVGTYDRVGPEVAYSDAKALIAFIQGDSDDLPEGLTEAEAGHMADVQDLFELLRYAMVAVIVLLIVLLVWKRVRTHKPLHESAAALLLSGGLLALGLVAAASIIALLSFQSAFVGFHALFFRDGSWTFSESSRLIQLFPEEFFQRAALSIAMDSVLLAMICVIAGALLGKKKNTDKPA